MLGVSPTNHPPAKLTTTGNNTNERKFFKQTVSDNSKAKHKGNSKRHLY